MKLVLLFLVIVGGACGPKRSALHANEITTVRHPRNGALEPNEVMGITSGTFSLTEVTDRQVCVTYSDAHASTISLAAAKRRAESLLAKAVATSMRFTTTSGESIQVANGTPMGPRFSGRRAGVLRSTHRVDTGRTSSECVEVFVDSDGRITGCSRYEDQAVTKKVTEYENTYFYTFRYEAKFCADNTGGKFVQPTSTAFEIEYDSPVLGRRRFVFTDAGESATPWGAVAPERRATPAPAP